MAIQQHRCQPSLMSLPLFSASRPALHVRYQPVDQLDAALADPATLAVFRFAAADAAADGRVINVGLRAHGPDSLEVWRGGATTLTGNNGAVRWMRNGALELACVEVEEPAGTDIAAAAEQAYRLLRQHQAGSATPHLLRVWNYLDAITEGDGDDERYRRFCVGRVRGLEQVDTGRLPAATCIGRYDGIRRLQVYWLASGHAGQPLENPRQISAFHYPRQYGPQPPSFARAMLPDPRCQLPLLLSGTAAITGHASLHLGSPAQQLQETLANIASLLQAGRAHTGTLPAHLDAGSPMKVYVREHQDLEAVGALLAQRLPAGVPCLILHAEVCRRELLVEIEGMHGMGAVLA